MIKQEPSTNPDANMPLQCNDNVLSIVTIDSYTEDSIIKSIPVESTWQTYLHNTPEPNFTEDTWNQLKDDDKYEELFHIKPSPHCEISSDKSTYVVTSSTEDAAIFKIPKKDCKLLLHTYAVNQGYPHYTSRIDTMDVKSMRDELIKAKQELSSRPKDSPKLNRKKSKQLTTPFMITHDTSDDEITNANESSLLQELQSMYTDRNLFDSVMWDSLFIKDLQDMAKYERDECLKLFSDDESPLYPPNLRPQKRKNLTKMSKLLPSMMMTMKIVM